MRPIVRKSYPKTCCGMFFLRADYVVTYVIIVLSNQWDQGSVMTHIQRFLTKQKFQHKHSTVLMEKVYLTITLTLILTWSSDRSPPLHHSLLLEPLWNPVHSCSLYLIFIFHSLSLSLSHLRSAVCHPSLSRSLHMFSISPCTDYTHTLPYLLLIHICQHINGLIRSRMLSYERMLGT